MGCSGKTSSTNKAALSAMRRAPQLASLDLAYDKNVKIIDIALQCGFENPESFTRAFKKVCGQTPRQFRKTPR